MKDRTSSLSKSLFLTVALVASALSSQAQATVIDFESTTTPGPCNVSVGGTVGGFTLSPNDKH